LLSDNAAVFSGRSRRGKAALELELERLGIEVKHSPCPVTPPQSLRRVVVDLLRHHRFQMPRPKLLV
jgi:hypothetical protein